MLIDFKQFYQGISDAYDNDEISGTYQLDLHCALMPIKFVGASGRLVMQYDQALIAISQVVPNSYLEATHLWKRLGGTLAAAISVAASESWQLFKCITSEHVHDIKSTSY